MSDAFPIVIIGISLVAIVIAVAASLASGGLYERIGRGAASARHSGLRAGGLWVPLRQPLTDESI